MRQRAPTPSLILHPTRQGVTENVMTSWDIASARHGRALDAVPVGHGMHLCLAAQHRPIIKQQPKCSLEGCDKIRAHLLARPLHCWRGIHWAIMGSLLSCLLLLNLLLTLPSASTH